MPDSRTSQTKVADARQKVRNLTVMQMRPNQSPQQLALLRSLEQSARAEARLAQKAQQHEASQPEPLEQQQAREAGMPLEELGEEKPPQNPTLGSPGPTTTS